MSSVTAYGGAKQSLGCDDKKKKLTKRWETRHAFFFCVPRHVVRSAAAVALYGWERRHVESAAWRWRARRKAVVDGVVRTHTRDMPKVAAVLFFFLHVNNFCVCMCVLCAAWTYITFLVGALQAQRRAFRLDVSDAAA